MDHYEEYLKKREVIQDIFSKHFSYDIIEAVLDYVDRDYYSTPKKQTLQVNIKPSKKKKVVRELHF